MIYDFDFMKFIKSSSHNKTKPHRNGMPACAMYFGDEAAHVDPPCDPGDPGGWPSFPSFQCLGAIFVGAIEPRLSIKAQDVKGSVEMCDVRSWVRSEKDMKAIGHECSVLCRTLQDEHIENE